MATKPDPNSKRAALTRINRALLSEHRKYCPGCDRILDLDDYYCDKRKTGGRAAKCKDCVDAYVRQDYQSKIEHKREVARNYQRKLREARKHGETPLVVPHGPRKRRVPIYLRNLFTVVPSAPIVDAVGKTEAQQRDELLSRFGSSDNADQEA